MPQPIHPDTRIGHVHLKVSDLDRAIGFYSGVLGFQVQQRHGGRSAFLSAGGYHHHLGLNTWDSLGGTPPPRGHTGLYHMAILYPDRPQLADAVRRVIEAGVDIRNSVDHGVSEAVYFADPDGNGVEIYHDLPEERWPRDSDGNVMMSNHPLDIEEILADAP